MMEVYFFPNGSTTVIDDVGQIPELQESWLLLFAKFLESKGIDPTQPVYHLQTGKAEVFKIPDGYNWRFRK